VNALWQSPIVILVVTTWLAAPPRNLSEAAQKEAFRRKATPVSKTTLSNIGLPPQVPLDATTPPSPPPAAGEAAKPDVKGEVKKDEAWWRKRITEATAALDRSRVLADALQSKINALQKDVVNLDNQGRRNQAREDLNRSLAELEKARKQIEDDQKAIDNIREEARKDNVPPGWVR
jgi:type IV secretory pathway VirB10-like protein